MERERERENEGNIDQLPHKCIPTRDWTCNLRICPDWELNPQPFSVLDDAPTSWATQPGWGGNYYLLSFQKWKLRLSEGYKTCCRWWLVSQGSNLGHLTSTTHGFTTIHQYSPMHIHIHIVFIWVCPIFLMRFLEVRSCLFSFLYPMSECCNHKWAKNFTDITS